jgi:gluconate 2-dehydrogenase gamma chain
MDQLHSRRIFLRAAAAASAGWVAVDVIQVEEALAWTAEQHAAHGGAPKPAGSALTKEEAEVLDAMTARIIPAVDGRAGAHEAGVVAFIDRSLSTFNAGAKPLYAGGVADLNRRAAAMQAGAGFVSLSAVQQDDILREIEQTPFFQAIRFDTIVGTFALPTWGGNHEFAGWKMIGLDHQPAFQAPFGYYDADVNRRG